MNQKRFFDAVAYFGFVSLPDTQADVGPSQLHLFRSLQGIINFDAEVAYGALEVGMPKQSTSL